MFHCCTSLQNLDVSGWDVSNVTNMVCVFNGCESLQSLDVSGWDVSSVTDMGYMFYGCSSLHTDTTMWKINTKDMESMYHDAPYIKHN